MKNKLIVLLSLVVIIATVCLCGCDNVISVERMQGKDDAEYVALNEKTIELIVGEKHTLKVGRYVKDCDVVTFSSADESIAIVDQDGVVTPLAKGTVSITATCGSYHDSCTVNVVLNHMSGSIFVKQITDNQLSLAKGTQLVLDTSVLFNSANYQFVPQYSVQDESICSVENGTLLAKNVGVTAVTVNGSWSGQPLEEYSFTVAVKNVPEFVVTDANSNAVLNVIELYTTAEFAGNTYNTEVTFDVKATLNGAEIDKNGIELEIVNNNRNVLFDVNAKKVKYRSNSGSCLLNMSFQYDGETYSKSITVTVKQPVTDYPEKIALDVSKGEIDTQNIFAIGSNAITEISCDAEEIILQNGKLFGFTVDREKSQMVTIFNGLVGYNVEIIPYTRIFTTAEELAYFHIEELGQSFGGYYILGNDIDASAYVHENNIRYAGESYNKYPNDGLVGVFDGKGHTIDGMTVGRSGFFGAIGIGGELKNVAFTNLKFTQVEDAVGIACYVNRAKISNVYVQANDLEGKNGQGYRTGLFAYHVDIACDVQNCIFELDTQYKPTRGTAKDWIYGSYTGYFSQVDTISSANPNYLKNCYVISPTTMTHVSGKMYVDSKQYTFDGETLAHYVYPNVRHYDNYVEMSQVVTNDYSSFDVSYWDLTNGYPQWKTANN